MSENVVIHRGANGKVKISKFNTCILGQKIIIII